MTATERKKKTEKKPLSTAAIEARRKYFREYNRKNKAKRQAWNDSHWERVAQAQADTQERQED